MLKVKAIMRKILQKKLLENRKKSNYTCNCCLNEENLLNNSVPRKNC